MQSDLDPFQQPVQPTLRYIQGTRVSLRGHRTYKSPRHRIAAEAVRLLVAFSREARQHLSERTVTPSLGLSGP